MSNYTSLSFTNNLTVIFLYARILFSMIYIAKLNFCEAKL